jgi:flagellar biosynthesis protein FlhF
MKIKSYYCPTVEDAMAMARRELGSEAMLLNSRPTPPEARHLGEYEVVFATEMASGETVEAFPASPPALLLSAAPGAGDRLSTEVSELRRELESIRRTLTRSAFAPPQWLGASPDLSNAYAALTASEVSPDLAREIVHCAESRAGTPGGTPAEPPHAPLPRSPRHREGAVFHRALVEEMESRFTVQPMLGRGEARPRIVALVGHPGAGKTTTLVRLAVNYGLASRRPVLLLSVDTYRVGAAEQLRSFAAILGVGFQVLETVAALAQTIEENRGKDLILIDTPGLAFGDLGEYAGLARFLSGRSDVDTQLVLSSSMKSADLTRVVDSFEVFRPQRLLFTKLDETGSFGPILNEAVRTGKPLSFFTTGQRIPEDLEAASRDRLVELILAGHCGRAQSAA